jgi:hypothetical protein
MLEMRVEPRAIQLRQLVVELERKELASAITRVE